jgi:hypothetical protein
VACTELLEAEGRALQHHIRRTGTALALTVVASVFLLLGLALLVLGAFWALESAVGRPLAALLCGLLSLAIAGGVAWLIKRPRR